MRLLLVGGILWAIGHMLLRDNISHELLTNIAGSVCLFLSGGFIFFGADRIDEAIYKILKG
jgi:hypothetical protein